MVVVATAAPPGADRLDLRRRGDPSPVLTPTGRDHGAIPRTAGHPRPLRFQARAPDPGHPRLPGVELAPLLRPAGRRRGPSGGAIEASLAHLRGLLRGARRCAPLLAEAGSRAAPSAAAEGLELVSWARRPADGAGPRWRLQPSGRPAGDLFEVYLRAAPPAVGGNRIRPGAATRAGERAETPAAFSPSALLRLLHRTRAAPCASSRRRCARPWRRGEAAVVERVGPAGPRLPDGLGGPGARRYLAVPRPGPPEDRPPAALARLAGPVAFAGVPASPRSGSALPELRSEEHPSWASRTGRPGPIPGLDERLPGIAGSADRGVSLRLRPRPVRFAVAGTSGPCTLTVEGRTVQTQRPGRTLLLARSDTARRSSSAGGSERASRPETPGARRARLHGGLRRRALAAWLRSSFGREGLPAVVDVATAAWRAAPSGSPERAAAEAKVLEHLELFLRAIGSPPGSPTSPGWP